MKVVINDCFGGFSVNPEIAKQYFNGERRKIERTNTMLINLIESGVNCDSSCASLIVVDIPDEATDWRIIEYDGVEYALYVIDGKMHSIY